MQRIGLVVHTSTSGNLILKAENTPRIGDKALDENLKPVGTVQDIFGPLNSPYVAVRPSVENSSQLTKHILYANTSSSKQRREKRKK